MRGIVEMRNRLGELGGIETRQSTLECAECTAGPFEYARVVHQIVRYCAFDEPVDTVGVIAVDQVPGSGFGGHEFERLLAFVPQKRGDELNIAHQIRRVGEHHGVHLLQNVPSPIGDHQVRDIDMPVPVRCD